MNAEHADLMGQVGEAGTWNDDIEAGFKAAIDKFVETQTY